MSDLTPTEKRKFERLLGMGGRYVLDFSNRTFSEFVFDSTNREIYDSRYDYGSGSKANPRLLEQGKQPYRRQTDGCHARS